MAYLPNKWDYDSPPIPPLVDKIGELTHALYSKQLPGSNQGVMRFFSLYWFILHHLDVPPARLRMMIVNRGIPIFTDTQMAQVVDTVRSQLGTSVAQRFLKIRSVAGMPPTVGGANNKLTSSLDSAKKVNESVPSSGPVTGDSSGASPFDDDPSRSKFWDKAIQKILYDVTKHIPPGFDGLAPIIFILYGLEQIEILGPLLATFFDTITIGLPTLAELVAASVKIFVSLAPIPYASFAGEFVAWFICFVFIMVSATMSVSRKQFGTAFTVGLRAVPLYGDKVSNTALKFEKGMERYIFNKHKMIDSVGRVSPYMASFIDYWAPELDQTPGPPIYFDSDLFLLDLFKTAIKNHGEDVAVQMVLDPSSMPAAAKNLVSNKYKSAIGPGAINAVHSVTSNSSVTNKIPSNSSIPNIPQNKQSDTGSSEISVTKNQDQKAGARKTRKKRLCRIRRIRN